MGPVHPLRRDMPPSAPSSLSFFDLLQPVGRGAMGEVWLATHIRGGARVAIKFLHVTGSQTAEAAQALSNEVRACARLAHPNIVTVLDHGVVSAGGHQARGQQFAAGTAYLVMEFVPGRSLQSVVGRLSWPRMREVLIVLLDALAHSHARGVIHRDLKPGNVLLRRAPMSDTSGRAPEPLITDFGVAQAFVDGASGRREVVGTPAYMAPEQLQARWRDQGPWTDLYSMGCLAWSLATGTPPFGRGRTFEENRTAHLEQEPPPFVPLTEVPPGLEGWLRRLLQKDPAHRYVRAADAMLGLLALPVVAPSSGLSRAPAAPVVPAPASERGPDTLTLSPLQSQALHQPLPPRPLSSEPVGVSLPPRVVERPIPADWQRPRPPALPPQLLGVGLSLYGLREVPLVNRVDEREALWAELCAVGADARPRAVLLQGPSGCGVTRLANWLAERAHELGAATVLTAIARNDESAGGEVGRMLAAHLRVEAMTPATRQRRLHRLLSSHGIDAPDVRRAMAELVGAGDGAQTAPSALAHPSERYRLLTQLLRAIATGPEGPRPLVVLLDDAQWSPDGLELTRRLLEAADSAPLPVLLVLTAGSDGLPERPSLRRLFDAVRDHPRTRTVAVRPLSTEHQTELVRLLLGMDGALAARVVRRSAGNPHFAVELIRDWVQEGKLQIGPDGFELQPFADVEMPKDLQQTWRTQVERQLSRLEPEEVRALELAAALGNDVDADEWHAVCKLTGTNPSPRLLAVLLRNRMATTTADVRGWSFVNPMYREVLAVRSRHAGRLRRIHLACARTLEFRASQEPGVAERVARHLLKANQPIPAAPQLLQAAEERLERGQTIEAERLIEVRDKLLRRLRLPTEDALWGQGWVQKARLLRVTGRSEAARELALRALQSAHRHGWEAIARGSAAELEALDGGPTEITPIT